MKLGFDIFRRLDDDSPLWVAQASSLIEARAQIAALRRSSPGRYFVRDAETGQSVTTDENLNPEGN
jgi:hypothetical protein